MDLVQFLATEVQSLRSASGNFPISPNRKETKSHSSQGHWRPSQAHAGLDSRYLIFFWKILADIEANVGWLCWALIQDAPGRRCTCKVADAIVFARQNMKKSAAACSSMLYVSESMGRSYRIIEADYNRPRQTLERHQVQNVKILCAAMRGWLFIAPNAWHRPRLPTPWWSRTRPCTDLHWLSSCGGLRNSWPKKRSWRSAEHSCPPMLVPC